MGKRNKIKLWDIYKITFKFIDGQDALFSSVRPVDRAFENGQTRSGRDIGRSTDDQEPIASFVVDGLDVVEERIAPKNALGSDIDGQSRCLVNGLRHQILHLWSVHVGTEDAAILWDEHETLDWIESQIGRFRHVVADDNSMPTSVQFKHVDFLSKSVGHEELVADPVDGDGHWQPGRRYAKVSTNAGPAGPIARFLFHWAVQRSRIDFSRFQIGPEEHSTPVMVIQSSGASWIRHRLVCWEQAKKRKILAINNISIFFWETKDQEKY